MKTKKIVVIGLFTFIGLLSIVLFFTNAEPAMPNIGIPLEENNKYFLLEVPAEINQYKTNAPVGISIKILSEDSILFPPNYGARIFQLKNQKWVELTNLVKYQEGDILLQSSENPFDWGFTIVFPDIADIHEPAKVRVVLIGHIVRDGKATDDLVGSYVDVNLKP